MYGFHIVCTFSGIQTVLYKTMRARRIRIAGKTEMPVQKVDKRYPGPVYNIVKFFFISIVTKIYTSYE